MATVQAFCIAGVKCWFWSRDHQPPHFHAKKDGQWEVKVRFLEPVTTMIEYESWSKRDLSRRERVQVCGNAESHRDELLREWERIQEQGHV